MGLFPANPACGGTSKMATQFCQKCKQSHPGRICDYDEKGECPEMPKVDEPVEPSGDPSHDEERGS